ncbi:MULTISPECIES: hypothetical protein [unclassified Streptomyces]|uniref:hypothetical protein n=1 Tax=unclassified Streptomyces TaxID=2593676 RepID=UPI00363E8214
MPDYFDRLLARYTPVPGVGGAEGAEGIGGTEGAGSRTRVRPRLPGPYERVEALRSGPQEPDEPAALLPSVAQPSSGPAELVRERREVRTDRHTVVRTEAVRPDGEHERPAGPDATPSTGPLFPPLSHRAPGPRPASGDSPRAPRRPAAPSASGSERTAPATTPRAATTPPAAAAPLRPRDADTTAARGTAPNGVGRRAPKQAERVVHVQIGRLEVTAAPPPGGNRPGAADRPDHTGRRGPALTLDAYLSRGEKTRN